MTKLCSGVLVVKHMTYERNHVNYCVSVQILLGLKNAEIDLQNKTYYNS